MTKSKKPRYPWPYNDRLFKLLRELDDSELEGIWTTALKMTPADKGYSDSDSEGKVRCISAELRAVHGHTLRNVFRGEHDLEWKRILIDVADKMKPGWGWTEFGGNHTEAAIERRILEFLDQHAKNAWSKLSADEKASAVEQLNIDISQRGTIADASAITVSSLSQGISAGLLAGSGAWMLAQGTAAGIAGGLAGGAIYQISFWIIVRIFGWITGAELVASGGLATIGGIFISAPVLAAFALNIVMSTSYRKSIPATVMILTAHELRRQLAAMENCL